jgi:hypothetical protein
MLRQLVSLATCRLLLRVVACGFNGHFAPRGIVSRLGQKRTFCFVPKADSCTAAIWSCCLELITWARPYSNGRAPRSQEDPAASEQSSSRAG